MTDRNPVATVSLLLQGCVSPPLPQAEGNYYPKITILFRFPKGGNRGSDEFKLQIDSMEKLYLKNSRKKRSWILGNNNWKVILASLTLLLVHVNIFSVPRAAEDSAGAPALSLCLLISSFIHKPCSQKESLQIVLSRCDTIEAAGSHKSSPPPPAESPQPGFWKGRCRGVPRPAASSLPAARGQAQSSAPISLSRGRRFLHTGSCSVERTRIGAALGSLLFLGTMSGSGQTGLVLSRG